MLSAASSLLKYGYPISRLIGVLGLYLPFSAQTLQGKELVDGDAYDTIQSVFKEHIKSPDLTIVEKPASKNIYAARNFKNTVVIIFSGMQNDIEALKGVLKHELAHVLNNDSVKMNLISAAATCSTSLLVRMYFGSSFLPLMLLPIAADTLVSLAFRHHIESRADDYCIENVTVDELKGCIRMLKAQKNPPFANYLPNPPMMREAKFQAALEAKGQPKYTPSDEELEPLKKASL